jgi:hypothetical protein
MFDSMSFTYLCFQKHLNCKKSDQRYTCRESAPLFGVANSKQEFYACSLPRVARGVMWEEVKSMQRICKSSYGGKVFPK